MVGFYGGFYDHCALPLTPCQLIANQMINSQSILRGCLVSNYFFQTFMCRILENDHFRHVRTSSPLNKSISSHHIIRPREMVCVAGDTVSEGRSSD